jgi:hypothetical protein
MRRHSSRVVALHRRTTLAFAILVVPGALAAQTTAPRPGPTPQGGPPGVTSPLPPRDRAQPPQSQAPVGTGSIQGRVTRADTGAPIPRATVFPIGRSPQAGPPTDSPSVTTDDRGVYQMSGLRAGQYSVQASKTGFVATSYGQRTPLNAGNTTIDLADRQALTGIDMKMPPGGVIEGRIFDEYGEPVAGAAVQVMRRRYVNGERRLTADSGTPTSITDDLGQFRVYGLGAGAHYLSATVSPPTAAPRPITMVGVVGSASPTYYPGTISVSEAMPITLTAGQQVSGFAVQISSAQLATISGTVRSASGRPIGTGNVMIANANGSSRGGSLRPDGVFTLPNAAPGEYTVTARATDLKEVASMLVTLAGTDVEVSLVTRPGATLKGRFVFDGGTPPANLRPEALRPTVQTAGNTQAPFAQSESPKTNDDWTFEFPVLVGSGLLRYSMQNAVAVGQPGAWSLKAVLRKGVDITDTPIVFNTDVDDVEIVLTQRVSVISGVLTASKGGPVSDARVVVFADDPQRWGPRSRFIGASRPDASGQFTVRGLPAGRYLAIAVDYLDAGDEQDPEILETLRRKATSLTLGDGESKTLNLKLAED